MSPVPYVSAHSRAQATKILFVVGAVLGVLTLLVSALSLAFPEFTGEEEPGENLVGMALALVSLGLAIPTIGVFIATVVVFLMWLHRAYTNLPAFGTYTGSLSHSPGWAVGSFFVPFANLVIPYRAVRELWQHSVPAEHGFVDLISPPASFPTWWTFWLVSNFANNIYFRVSLNGGFSEQTTTIIGVVSDALSILSAVFAFEVVSEIDRRQEETSRSLHLGKFAVPPPPTWPDGSVTSRLPALPKAEALLSI